MSNSVFGKPNRPQTPVTGIITNDYGAQGEAAMKERYDQVKSYVSFELLRLSNTPS